MGSTDDTLLNHQLEQSYRLLSACLCQPSVEWSEADLFARLKEALLVVAPTVADRADAMAGALKSMGETELAVVYARLFVGPFSLEALPYGSYYLEPDRKVMGETTVAARNFYLQAGLALDEGFGELPDHMAVELEFLSYLLQRTMEVSEEVAEEAARWIDRRRDFIRTFLAGWYTEFCAAIRTATDNPFYRAYADCLEAVVGRDRELLGLA